MVWASLRAYEKNFYTRGGGEGSVKEAWGRCETSKGGQKENFKALIAGRGR